MQIRPARSDDLDLLWTFLAMAAYESSAAAAKAIPMVAAHLADWKRPSDFGFIAMRDATAIGAAWARQFLPAEQPAIYVDERTPELSIAVLENARGHGVGRTLLNELILEAQRRAMGLCLTVRDVNPAVRLYGSVGFHRVPGSEVRNRVGGLSIGMLHPRLGV
jgi:GNAT superfamily N-acetyltransferase